MRLLFYLRAAGEESIRLQSCRCCCLAARGYMVAACPDHKLIGLKLLSCSSCVQIQAYAACITDLETIWVSRDML